MARRIVLLPVLLLGVASVSLSSARGEAGAADCPGPRVQAQPDGGFNERFAVYGNDNTLDDDWTGGDGAYSVRLPDGRDVWTFGDTFLGLVREDGSRPTNAPFINNSMVIQRSGGLVETLHGGTAESPTAFFVPEDGASWYWPQKMVVEGDHLRAFLHRFERTGPGPWDFEWVGTDIATLSLPDLAIEAINQAPSETGVAYGAAVVEHTEFTLIYGVEDQPFVNYLHLARAPRGAVLGSWEFLGPSGWSPDPADSVRLLSGVGIGFSVTTAGGRFLLVTMAESDFFGHEIVIRVACRAWGPWGPEISAYDAPEHENGLFSYNAHAHPQFTERGGVLVSYDVNTFNGQELWRDVTIYRPRFVRVRIRV